MTSSQRFRRVPNRTVLSLFLYGLLIFGTTACADPAQVAAENGALAANYLQTGDLPAAREAVNAALTARDDDISLHLLRGRIEYAAGDQEAAYSAFYNALALDPVNPEALQGVSQLGLANGNLTESLKATERILSMAPEQPDALLIRGMHALSRRKFDEAAEYADTLLSVAPENDDARILRARALYQLGRKDEALAAVGGRGNLSDRPITSGTALTRLEIFRDQRDAAGMAAEFQRLRGLRPDDTALRLDEANFAFKRGNYEAANGLLVAVMTDANLDPPVAAGAAEQAVAMWTEYGLESVTDGDWQRLATGTSAESRARIARYLLDREMPGRARPFIAGLEGKERLALGARLQAARGDARAALALANRVLGQDATYCSALVASSQALLHLRRVDKAVENGQLASIECPDRVDGYLAAARAYTAWNRSTAANRVFAEGFDALPQNLLLATAFAQSLLERERGREAVAITRRYTRDNASSVAGWKLYGKACAEANRNCVQEARTKGADAATRYGADLPPGQLRPNGLFGRFVTRSAN